MKKALLISPAPSVHERFNQANMDVLRELSIQVHAAANFEAAGAGGEQSVFSHKLEKRDVVCHHIPFYRRSFIKNIPAIKSLRTLIQKERFSIIHAHTETGGLVTRLACLNIPGRYIYTMHGMSLYTGCPLYKKLLYYPLQRWIFSGMDDVIAVNSEEYAQLCRWDRERAHYTHGVGADISPVVLSDSEKAQKRSELGMDDDAYVLVSVGELNENKNHAAVIRAVSGLDAPDIRYLICGAGALNSSLQTLARTLGAQNKIILPGYRQDVGAILQIADVFVHPSYHEGLPVALLEAMAAGLPVVCSRIRGVVDLIDDGVNGYLCAPDDPDGFAAALERLQDKSIRDRMGRLNQKRVRSFSTQTVRHELKKIYQEAGLA